MMLSAPSSTTLTKHGYKTHKMNPLFEAPARPFPRMTYGDAIKDYNEHGTTTRGSLFHWRGHHGEVGARDDRHGREPDLHDPLPGAMNVFCVKHIVEDRTLTGSVDLVILGVGEIVGVSMRSTTTTS